MSPHSAAIVLTAQAGPECARAAIAAAQALGASTCELWCFGAPPKAMMHLPVGTVIWLEDSGEPVAERYHPALRALYAERKPQYVLFAEDAFSSSLAAGFGCAPGGSCALSITGVACGKAGGVRVTRRVYGLQLEAEMHYAKPPFVFSLAGGSFMPVRENGEPTCIKSGIALAAPDWYEEAVWMEEEQETRLADFDRILVGGRGLGNANVAGELAALGAQLGAGVGGSRPAVQNGWLPQDRMVGLSGSVVAPDVCITIGVSGCVPLQKGVEHSRLLVAVNHDPNAMVFRYCDIGVVDDSAEFIRAFTQIAQERDRHA